MDGHRAANDLVDNFIKRVVTIHFGIAIFLIRRGIFMKFGLKIRWQLPNPPQDPFKKSVDGSFKSPEFI